MCLVLGSPRPNRALVRGEASGPDRAQRELEAGGVKLHVVPAAGHGMMWEHSDGFVEVLKRALAAAS